MCVSAQVRVCVYLSGLPLLFSHLPLLLTQEQHHGCFNGLLPGLLSRICAHDGEMALAHHNLTGVSERDAHDVNKAVSHGARCEKARRTVSHRARCEKARRSADKHCFHTKHKMIEHLHACTLGGANQQCIFSSDICIWI